MRGGAWLSPWGPSAHPALDQHVSRGPREQAGGLVLQGSRAFTRTAPWLGPRLEVVTRSLIPTSETSTAAAVCMCHSLWGLPPPYQQPAEPEGR